MKNTTYFFSGISILIAAAIFMGFLPNSHLKTTENNALSDIFYITNPSGSKALTVNWDEKTVYLGAFNKGKSQEWRWVGSSGQILQSVYYNKFLGWEGSASVQLYPSGDHHILKWVKSRYSGNSYYIQKADSRSNHLYIDNDGSLKTGYTKSLWKLERKPPLTSVTISALGDPRLLNIVDVSLVNEKGYEVTKTPEKFRNGRCTFTDIPEGCYTIRVVEPSLRGKVDQITWNTEQRNVCINRSTRHIRFSKRVAK